MSSKFFSFFLIISISGLLLSACSSQPMQERKQQRDKLAVSAKLYCEFLNAEATPDIDVALNVEMAKRCDSNKSMTITSYRSPSEATGVIYCCTTKDKEDGKRQNPLDSALGTSKTEVRSSPQAPVTPAVNAPAAGTPSPAKK